MKRNNKLAELSVVEQCLNIYKSGIVQRKRLQNQEDLNYKRSCLIDCDLSRDITPRIHGLVYNNATGTLKRLSIEYNKNVGDLDHMYDIRDVN